MSGTWDKPDFSDPRFSVQDVRRARACRRSGCDRLAAYLVDYTMRHRGWSYEYECGYCDEHLPQACMDRLLDSGEDA